MANFNDVNSKSFKKQIIYLTAVGLFFADRVIKQLVLLVWPEKVLINSKAVFGFLPWWLSLFGLLIIWLYRSSLAKNPWVITLILTGSLSNLIDRILKGGVVDFLKIWRLPWFNLADVMIAAGLIWFLEKSLWSKKNS